MRFYRLIDAVGEPRVVVEAEDGVLADLTSIRKDVVEVEQLVQVASLSRRSIEDIALGLLNTGSADSYDLAEIIDASRDGTGDLWLDVPIEPPEVWAFGVTYQSSVMERQRESETPDVYAKAYNSDRPALFLKATPERYVGPFESVGVRADSTWNVPEPELAFVLYNGAIIGYTAGNDMSSRSIEGENPLYQAQAKQYTRCCAIGPSFVPADSIGDAQNLEIHCTIVRDGNEIFADKTSTSLMNRKLSELAEWAQRHNTLPNMTTVLTGTSIVPPPRDHPRGGRRRDGHSRRNRHAGERRGRGLTLAP